MPEPAETGKSSRFLWLLFLMPVLYLLSTGPVLLLFEHSGRPSTWEPLLETVYYPVEWLYQNSDAARRVLELYLELFR